MPRRFSIKANVNWILGPQGEACFDRTLWGDHVASFFQRLYSSSLENSAEKQIRLKKLESYASASRLDGVERRVPLPWSTFLEARDRLKKEKQGGWDGLVSEMFEHLSWEALTKFREAFEDRLNGKPGHGGAVCYWHLVRVWRIPKKRAAHNLADWRPICLVSALAKWYQNCLIDLLRTDSSPPRCCTTGFETGRQAMEVTELTRTLLQRETEWDRPLFVGRGDVRKAFDSIEHPLLDSALSARGAPLRLRIACLRELCDLELEICLQGATSDRVHLGKGGLQAGSKTPGLWNFLLDFFSPPRSSLGPSLVSAWRWATPSCPFLTRSGRTTSSGTPLTGSSSNRCPRICPQLWLREPVVEDLQSDLPRQPPCHG